jgi:hypothetical protein
MPYIFTVYSANTQKVKSYRCGILWQNPFEGQTIFVTDTPVVFIKMFQEKAFTRHTKARGIYFLLGLCSM